MRKIAFEQTMRFSAPTILELLFLADLSAFEISEVSADWVTIGIVFNQHSLAVGIEALVVTIELPGSKLHVDQNFTTGRIDEPFADGLHLIAKF